MNTKPLTVWLNRICGWVPIQLEPEDVAHRALPVEDFERMAADARAYLRVLDVIADPRLRDAPIAKTLADLGLDQPAGPPVKVMFFTNNWPPASTRGSP